MMKVRFEGGAELARELNALPLRVSKSFRRAALVAGAEPIRQNMAQMAPREPGAPDLADNIVISNAKADGLQDNDLATAVAVGPEKKFYYGYMQEFGTIHHGAHPFARPGFDAGVTSALAIISKATWMALAKRGVTAPVGPGLGMGPQPDSRGDE